MAEAAQAAPAAPAGFDVDARWRLSPSVALRPESFGALAYHFGNRRLTFLKSPRMVELVRVLEQHGSAREAMAAVGITAAEQPSYQRALASLVRSDVVVPLNAHAAPAAPAKDDPCS